MRDRDRIRAFAASAACLALALVALPLLAAPRERPRADAGAPAPSAAARDGAARPAPGGRPAAPDAEADVARPILPAGQALSRADAERLRSAPSAPRAARLAARRFAAAYLRYELGSRDPAQHDAVMALTGGSLRAELQHEPPRAPLGVRLHRGRLVSLAAACGGAAAGAPTVCQATYAVRRGDRFTAHSIKLEREDGTWLVTGLAG